MQAPPGGPPDFTPPKLLGVTPDSGAIVPGWHDPVLFRFDEVLTEPTPQAFERLVLVSPRPKKLSLGWHRTALSVEPDGGWKPGVTYRVELLPGVSDLRNNRATGRSVLVFSTGGTIPTGQVRGMLVDWAGGRIVTGGLLEAIRLSDSLTYVSVTDSTGDAVVDHLPPGPYLIVGTVDQNGNQRRDPREAFDSATVTLDSAVTRQLWAFAHDTLGPRLRAATLADSITAKLEFNQMLSLAPGDSTALRVVALPDSTPVRFIGPMRQPAYDSLVAQEQRERARADSITRAAQADSTRRARPDTGKANPGGRQDSTGRRPSVRNPTLPRGVSGDSASRGGADPGRKPGGGALDTARVNVILRQRPKLSDLWFVRFPQPVPVNARYVVRADAANLTGAKLESQAVLAGPKPAADSAARGRGAGRRSGAPGAGDSAGRGTGPKRGAS
jgi:hypothetical protein